MSYGSGETLAVTPEQVAQFNAAYAFELWTSYHGDDNSPGDARSLEAAIAMPTQAEYDWADSLLTSMHSGDLLFMESYGQPSPTPTIEELERLEAERSGFKDIFRQSLENARRSSGISVFTYAGFCAVERGVEVLWADFDVAEAKAAFIKASNRTPKELNGSQTPEDQDLMAEINRQRVAKAIGTVIHEALMRLPDPVDEERKPKAALMYGAGHAADLQSTLRGAGIEYSLHTTPGMSATQRILLHLGFTDSAKAIGKMSGEPATDKLTQNE